MSVRGIGVTKGAKVAIEAAGGSVAAVAGRKQSEKKQARYADRQKALATSIAAAEGKPAVKKAGAKAPAKGGDKPAGEAAKKKAEKPAAKK